MTTDPADFTNVLGRPRVAADLLEIPERVVLGRIEQRRLRAIRIQVRDVVRLDRVAGLAVCTTPARVHHPEGRP